jgi:large-conductance mechanosensitive channel
VYFLIVRPFSNVAARLAARSAPPPDVQLLTEIRDLLKTRSIAGV